MNASKFLIAFLIGCSLSQLSTSLYGQSRPTPIRLWQGDAPGAKGQSDDDIPTIMAYLPETRSKPTGAIVIFPGGGYGTLAIDHEGHQIARWANRMGMAGIIVSYRHRGRGYGHPYPMLDAQRAIRFTRSKAEEWNIDPTKVGVIGFSAGGHLATTVLTHFDASSEQRREQEEDEIDQFHCRPDFGIVCYAVIAFKQGHTHRGSQKNLLGDDPDPEIVTWLSNEKQVTPETPPCFVWHTAEDQVVPAENSLQFYSALVRSRVPSELHIFAKGRHGIGLGQDIPGANQWPTLCRGWLERNGFKQSNAEAAVSAADSPTDGSK